MKKLLNTTALVGAAALVASAAVADVKVSGNYIHTLAFGSDDTSAGTDSGQETGGEFNITFSANAALDNGMTAKLVSNMESDASGNGFDDREYSLSIGSDDAYIQFASDAGNSTNSSAVPTIGYHPGTYATIAGSATVFQDTLVMNIMDNENISFNAKVAGGTITARYTPKAGISPGNDATAVTNGTSGSGTELVYNGSPMEGLNVSLGMISKQEDVSSAGDDDMHKVSASYNFGSFTVGAEWMDFDDGSATNASGAESQWIGASAALSDQVSIGISYAKQEDQAQGNTNPDEKITTVEIGYNLGGAALVIAASDIENAGNSQTDDAQVVVTRLKMSF
jgi:hypothetical protein